MIINDKCYWDKTVEFINNLSDNESFRPLELKKHVYLDNEKSSTVGTYITFLEQTNFIERISKGHYIRIKDIPLTLTTTKVYNYLHNNPLKERKDKIEQIQNKLKNE